MLTLAAGNTISGIADAANKVTVTLFGKTLVSGSAAYLPLAQAQLAASAGTLYAAPNPGVAFIRDITVVNTDTVARTFQLFQGGTAAANAITPVFGLAAGTMATYGDNGWNFYTAQGALIQNPYQIPTGFLPGKLGSSGCVAATHGREYMVETNTTLITTGQVFMQAVFLQAGQVISAIRIWSATTAANGPTHQNAGLYDSSGNRLATGTDRTSTAWGANTLATWTLQASYTVPTTGLYYVALGITASTTVPTIKGNTARTDGAVQLASPPLCGVSTTAYATGDMPSTLGLPTAKSTVSMYAELG